MKRHRGTLNAYVHVKEDNLKRLHLYDSNCMISEKGKTMETVKNISGCQRWEGGMTRRSTEDLGAVKILCRYYKDGHMSLYICPNP